MPPMNERVAAMVRAAITKDPTVDNAELRRRALEIDRAVRRLSPRQFHATYRLPALRGVAGAVQAVTRPSKRSVAVDQRPAGGSAQTMTRQAGAPAGNGADAVTGRSPESRSPSAAPVSPAPRATADSSNDVAERTPSTPSRSTALARPHAAEREAVRSILQVIAREALVTEDRASFVRLLDSLDERAAVILGLFGRA